MTTKRIFLLATTLVVCLAQAGTADAQRRRRGGAAYTERHVTLPARTIRFDFGPYERSLNEAGLIDGPYGSGGYGLRFLDQDADFDGDGDEDLWITHGIGLAFGINDRVEIGAMVLPLVYAPDADYGDLTTYVRWAFLDRRNVQIGLQGIVQFPTWTDFGFGVGLPMNFNLGRVIRLEMGVEFEVVFDREDDDLDGDPDAVLALDFPIALTGRIARRGFLGGRADLFLYDLEDDAAGPDDVDFIPAIGMHGGATIFGRRTTTADFTGQFLVFLNQDETPLEWELTFGANVSLGL